MLAEFLPSIVLAALDRVDDTEAFISDLGIELVKMRDSSPDDLDSMLIKDILTSEEDSRIARRIARIARRMSSGE